MVVLGLNEQIREGLGEIRLTVDTTMNKKKLNNEFKNKKTWLNVTYRKLNSRLEITPKKNDLNVLKTTGLKEKLLQQGDEYIENDKSDSMCKVK